MDFPCSRTVFTFSHTAARSKHRRVTRLYYSDLVANFNEEIKTTKLSFNANIEELKFPTGAIGLRNVVISEGPGKLIGIMGASGAGKTTLLERDGRAGEANERTNPDKRL